MLGHRSRELTVLVLGWVLIAACGPAAPPTTAAPAPTAKPAAPAAPAPAAAPAAQKPEAPAQPAAAKPTALFQQLVEKAKAEGEVRLAVNHLVDEIKPALDVFEKQFGIKVVYERVTGVEAMQRLIAEHVAGRDIGYDAFYPGDEFMAWWVNEKGVVAPPFEYRQVWPSLHVDQMSPDGWGVSLSAVPNNITYNKKMVGNTPPKNWDDCADPRWRGNIVVDTRISLYSFAYHDPDWFYPWVTKLKDNGARLTRGLSDVLQNLLVTGESAIHCTQELSVGLRAEKASPDLLGNTLPDPYSIRASSYTFIYQRAKKPHAAQLVVGWLATDGLKMIDEAAPGRGFPWVAGTWLAKNAGGAKFKMCDAKCIADVDRLQRRYQEALGVPTK